MLRSLKITYEYFALYSSLTLLGLICLTWTVFALPLYFILPRRLGTAVGRRGIMTGFSLYAWSLSITRAYHLDLRDIDSLKAGPPVRKSILGRPKKSCARLERRSAGSPVK